MRIPILLCIPLALLGCGQILGLYDLDIDDGDEFDVPSFLK